MPSRLQQRENSYKIAFGMVMTATPLAIYGLIAPGWIRIDGLDIYTGLWWACQIPFDNCVAVADVFGVDCKYKDNYDNIWSVYKKSHNTIIKSIKKIRC